ncbi:hypothetical protein BH11PSE14_BH11PSE14_21400 [soil metagenome]
MASTTLCFTGFSREEATQVQQQFEQANSDGRFALAAEGDAQVLVIDMDSLYGHMTWLKAHSGGQTTVGVTAGERAETDFLLRRPIDAAAMRALLRELGIHALVRGAGAPAAPSAPALRDAGTMRESAPAVEAPTPQAPQPEAPVAAAPAEAAPHASEAYIAAVTTGQMAAMPAQLLPHQPRLSDFLARGRLTGPARLQFAGAPTLVFDPASQTWAGSAALKPVVGLLDRDLGDADFEPVDSAEFERAKAAGGAHPYLRLLWLSGLVAGSGQLLVGYTPAKKFVLSKWPQIEREYSRHFRLATVMMKGPALVRELVESSGVAEAEVIDFINAGLVIGSIVVEGEAVRPADVERAVALLARPRAA